jgi:hypothetical protein
MTRLRQEAMAGKPADDMRSAPSHSAAPQRLPYFYSAAWNMDTVSRLTNGLPGKKICGATNFRNPYDDQCDGSVAPAARVQLFRDMLNDPDSRRGRWIKQHVHELAGHNLFCICRKGAPCSGDVLIELANGRLPIPPAPAGEGSDCSRRMGQTA